MATQDLTLPGALVKKHNELVRTKISIAHVDGSRILANLIACVKQDDTEFKGIYRVQVKDFMSDQGGKDYTNIKNVCRELAKATAEIEEIDPDNRKPILRLYTFFTSITYNNGVIKARFNWEMKPLLLNLRQCFTQYNLTDYLSLPSLYSQRMFEILKSWANLPEVVLPIAELHRLLDTPESMRNDFAQFRLRVLEKAHRDIHAKTSLKFEWEQVKPGLSVEAVRFLFGPSRQAIAEAELTKLKEEKARRLHNQRMITALDCARSKAGDCRERDNKRLVCKVCLEFQFCKASCNTSKTSPASG